MDRDKNDIIHQLQSRSAANHAETDEPVVATEWESPPKLQLKKEEESNAEDGLEEPVQAKLENDISGELPNDSGTDLPINLIEPVQQAELTPPPIQRAINPITSANSEVSEESTEESAQFKTELEFDIDTPPSDETDGSPTDNKYATSNVEAIQAKLDSGKDQPIQRQNEDDDESESTENLSEVLGFHCRVEEFSQNPRAHATTVSILAHVTGILRAIHLDNDPRSAVTQWRSLNNGILNSLMVSYASLRNDAGHAATFEMEHNAISIVMGHVRRLSSAALRGRWQNNQSYENRFLQHLTRLETILIFPLQGHGAQQQAGNANIEQSSNSTTQLPDGVGKISRKIFLGSVPIPGFVVSFYINLEVERQQAGVHEDGQHTAETVELSNSESGNAGTVQSQITSGSNQATLQAGSDGQGQLNVQNETGGTTNSAQLDTSGAVAFSTQMQSGWTEEVTINDDSVSIRIQNSTYGGLGLEQTLTGPGLAVYFPNLSLGSCNVKSKLEVSVLPNPSILAETLTQNARCLQVTNAIYGTYAGILGGAIAAPIALGLAVEGAAVAGAAATTMATGASTFASETLIPAAASILFGTQTTGQLIMQMKREGEAENGTNEPIQRHETEAENSTQSNDKNGLSPDLKESIQSNIGVNTDHLNFHSDSQSATDLGALAYRKGSDIHFAPGQFNPGTTAGDHLIAHEVAHTTQNPTADTNINGQPVNTNKGLEAAADSMADKVVQNKQNPNAIQRKENVMDATDDPIIGPVQQKSVVQRAKESSSVIQRKGPDAKNKGTVKFPLGLGTATNASNCIDLFIKLGEEITELQNEVDENDEYPYNSDSLEEHQDQIDTQIEILEKFDDQEEHFDKIQAAILDYHLKNIKEGYDFMFDDYKSFARSSITKATKRKTFKPMTPEMAEAKRKAFEDGDEDTLEKILEITEAVKKYNDKIEKYVDYASKMSKKVKDSEKIKSLKKATGSIGSFAGKAENVLKATKILTKLTSDKSSDLAVIDHVQTGLDAIDFGMSFVKAVPVLGALWTNYYYPVASACLKGIARIAKIKGKENRMSTIVSRDWHTRKTPPSVGGVGFPGGQTVFNFMWWLLKGSYKPSSAVKDYFMDNEDKFNAGSKSKLKTERYGFMWHDKRTKNFETWVKANKYDIWLMLYGLDIPFPGGTTSSSILEYNEAAQMSVDDGTTVQRSEANPSDSSGNQGISNELQSSLMGVTGVDVNSLNFHTNSSSAQTLGARAYSQGNDIHFAPGEYNPGTKEGDHLIAHEVAHKTQKSGLEATTEINGVPVNDDPGLEAAADQMADKVVQNKKNEDSGPFQLKDDSSINSTLQLSKAENSKPFNIDPASSNFNHLDNRTQFTLPTQLKSNGNEEPIQGFGLPSWDDIKGAAGDAWDATGGQVVDAATDVYDWGSDMVGGAWDAASEEALKLALKALNGAQELISWLAGVSQGVARKAIEILSRIDPMLLVDFLILSPAHELADFVIRQLLKVYNTVDALARFLGNVGVTVGKRVLEILKSIDVDLLIDFVIQLPGNALSAFATILLNTAQIARIFIALSVEAAAELIKTIYRAGLMVEKLIRAMLELAVERLKEIVNLIGEFIVKSLVEAYSLFLEVLKKIIDWIWPVGWGINLEGGIGATFAIPIHVGVDYITYIQHKDQNTFYLFRKGEVEAGVDTGVGAGGFIGSGLQRGGNGDQAGSNWGVGAEAGANAGAGLRMHVIQEFDFPIYEDLAFISFVFAATGQDTTAPFMAAKILAPGRLNLDPMVYNTKTQFRLAAFGEASAEAGAGVRLGEGEGSSSSTWGRNDPKPDTGSRVEGPWYSPMKLINKLRASAGANINIEAGVGLEMRQIGFTENENGEREPDRVEMDLFGEGQIAANIHGGIPFVPIIPNLGIDSTLGLKVTFAFNKKGEGQDNFDYEFVGYKVYYNTGDMDVIDGPASETELTSTESFTNFMEFLEGVQSLKRKQRLSLESAFGKQYMAAARRQEFTRSLLGSDYRKWGVTLQGFLTYEFTITKENIKAIMTELWTQYQSHFTGEDGWRKLVMDVINFFNNGTIPGYIADIVSFILSRLNISEVTLRGQAKIGVAGDVQASAGAKVRLHGRLAGGVFYEKNMISELGLDGALSQAEARDLLVNGATYVGLNVGPSENPELNTSESEEQQTSINNPEDVGGNQSDGQNSQESTSVSENSSQNQGSNGSSLSTTSQESQNQEGTDPRGFDRQAVNTAAEGDSIQENIFHDSQEGVRFDEEALAEQFLGSTFQGANDIKLRLAMMALYGSPGAGFRRDMALSVIASTRGMTFDQAESQYEKALSLRAQARSNYISYGHEGDPAPDLNLVLHPLFTASNGQLRFGKIIGDVFGLDAVFGSLISPTGGIVGPGNSIPSVFDEDDPVAIHGTVHDAGGFLFNCFRIGPGYDYLGNEKPDPNLSESEQEETNANPYAGQTNINWWIEQYEERNLEVSDNARAAGRGSFGLMALAGRVRSDAHTVTENASAEQNILELAPQHVLYEIAAHDFAYKEAVVDITKSQKDLFDEQGYDANAKGGIQMYNGALGFQAVLINSKDGQKNAILAIRGTNPGTSASDLETVFTDLDEVAVGKQQFDQNAILIQTLLETANTDKVDVVGHSLGGAMAQHTAVNFPEKIANVVTFQSPGIDQESADRFNSLSQDDRPNVTHHIVTGDVVDRAGEANLVGDVYEYNYGNHLNLFELKDTLSTMFSNIGSAIEELKDIDWTSPSKNARDYEALMDRFGELKDYLTKTGKSIGDSHGTRIFSGADFAAIRQEMGIEDSDFGSGVKSDIDAEIRQFDGHPHQTERELAETLRSMLGPQLQKILGKVIAVIKWYESVKESISNGIDNVRDRVNDAREYISDGIENTRRRITDGARRLFDRLPF